MTITRFVPNFMTLTILMTSSVAASTMNGRNEQLIPQGAVGLTISQQASGIQASDVYGAPKTVFAAPVCNPNSFAVGKLVEPYRLVCEYFSPVQTHSKQTSITEFQISPSIGNTVTFRGWSAWSRDGNALPPGHYDTDSADNRHVRLEFRFGFHVNQNGRLQLQLND